MITTYDIFRFSQRENRLTAQLMLALEMNKDLLLKKFLRLCQLESRVKNGEEIKIKLQDFEEESTPDAAFFNDTEKIAFIECKLRSTVDPDQLIAHVRSGKGSTHVICISSGKREPEEMQLVRQELTKKGFIKTLIHWIGWQQIYTELHSLPQEALEKPEIRGLMMSLERENLASLVFKGFIRDELVQASEFVKRYPVVFGNAKRLLEAIVEYAENTDSDVEVLYSGKSSTTFPVMEQVSAVFRYLGAEQRYIAAVLVFDFSKGCVHQKCEFPSKHVKRLGTLQLETIVTELGNAGFKFERYNKGNLEEVADLQILEQLPDELHVVFSRYYPFHNDIFYSKPEELVKFIGDGILWLLNFFRAKGLFNIES